MSVSEPASMTRQTEDAARLIRELHDVLLLAQGYPMAIANGRQPAITAEGRAVAADRMERIDAALADAADYLGRG